MSDTPDPDFLALQEALLGRYSLQRELGRGGMGVVYLAHEVRLDRPVALKVLPPDMAARPALRERFLREARTAAKLSHPNIVPIHAVGEVGDFVFFAMAYVEGESLGQRIRERGPLRPADAARILREVSWALGYAHGQGVVHRDVKPDNILLEAESGRAIVTDFGIAHVAESEGLTGVAEILGTAEFMSPEQASGDAVDARSDLYSLGIVGHYMLSGRLPFQGTSLAATLAKHLTQEAPALGTIAPEAPANLSQAIDRCLAKDPDDRFQSGEGLAEALTDSLAARREVPTPIRVFQEDNKQATTLVWGMGLTAFAGALYFIGRGSFFEAGGMTALLALVVWGMLPFGFLAKIARRLLRSGYGYEEMIQALRSEVEQRRQDLESEYRGRSRLNRWATRIALGSGAAFFSALALYPFAPFTWVSTLFDVMGVALITGFPSTLAALATHDVVAGVPGERWLKFWKTRIGRGIFKLAKLRLGSVETTGAAYGPTEMAIGMAADRLFEGLPKELRRSFGELPDVVRALEHDADRIRSRIKELDALLAQIESEEALGESERLAASSGVTDRRGSLADDLSKARDAADARLSEVVEALETIRLELLRMHAGAGSVESMTADLTSARELSDDIERVLEGAREVEKLLGDAS